MLKDFEAFPCQLNLWRRRGAFWALDGQLIVVLTRVSGKIKNYLIIIKNVKKYLE
jgi:hypothetical protein